MCVWISYSHYRSDMLFYKYSIYIYVCDPVIHVFVCAIQSYRCYWQTALGRVRAADGEGEGGQCRNIVCADIVLRKNFTYYRVFEKHIFFLSPQSAFPRPPHHTDDRIIRRAQQSYIYSITGFRRCAKRTELTYYIYMYKNGVIYT